MQIKKVSATKIFTFIYEISLNIFCMYVFLKVADSATYHKFYFVFYEKMAMVTKKCHGSHKYSV